MSAGLVAVIVAGCDLAGPSPQPTATMVPLLTAPSAQPGVIIACNEIRVGGVLTAITGEGLGLTYPNGRTTGVIWPFGYRAWMDGTQGVALVDSNGRTVAHEGDLIQASGNGGDGPPSICQGSIVVLATRAPSPTL